MRVAVLLSLGRHPVSGRARLAPDEAGALLLARSLGAEVTALHAGPAAQAQPLHQALGLGASELRLIGTDAGHDPLPALQQALGELAPDLVLCASAAEAGPATGMLPHVLAVRLGLPLASDVTALLATAETGRVALHLAESGGRRRLCHLPLPGLVILRLGAISGGFAALGAIRRGRVTTLEDSARQPDPLAEADLRPARRRPRRLSAPGAAPAAPAGGVHHPGSPEAAAELIHSYLRQEGLIPSGHTQGKARDEQV